MQSYFNLNSKKQVELHLPVALSMCCSLRPFLAVFLWVWFWPGAGDDEAWQLLQETWTFAIGGQDSSIAVWVGQPTLFLL